MGNGGGGGGGGGGGLLGGLLGSILGGNSAPQQQPSTGGLQHPASASIFTMPQQAGGGTDASTGKASNFPAISGSSDWGQMIQALMASSRS